MTIAAVLVLATAYEVWTWPRVAALVQQRPQTTAFIERFRQQQRAARRIDRVDWRWAPYGSIAPAVKRAVLVAEDVNFFSHRGFDFAEIENAVREAVEEGVAPRGASTLTQQLAKNLWLSPSRNPYRKLKEAILTWQLERALSKRRILELYLNVVELGPGVFGVEAASQRYFGKAAAGLDDDQAAQLAAILPNPAAWRPGAASRAYQRHVATIRRRMDRADFLARQVLGGPPDGGAVRHDALAGSRDWCPRRRVLGQKATDPAGGSPGGGAGGALVGCGSMGTTTLGGRVGPGVAGLHRGAARPAMGGGGRVHGPPPHARAPRAGNARWTSDSGH